MSIASSLGIESSTRIMQSQFDCIGCTGERHFELVYTTVFQGVVNSFLQNTEKAEGDFAGKIFRNTLATKVNFDVLPLRELAAKSRGRRFESELFELRRM